MILFLRDEWEIPDYIFLLILIYPPYQEIPGYFSKITIDKGCTDVSYVKMYNVHICLTALQSDSCIMFKICLHLILDSL